MREGESLEFECSGRRADVTKLAHDCEPLVKVLYNMGRCRAFSSL